MLRPSTSTILCVPVGISPTVPTMCCELRFISSPPFCVEADHIAWLHSDSRCCPIAQVPVWAMLDLVNHNPNVGNHCKTSAFLSHRCSLTNDRRSHGSVSLQTAVWSHGHALGNIRSASCEPMAFAPAALS